ncbi:MAG TPA: biotin/lipoyl-binding carrier protein [bacterium]|jgi:acetyl-CoA carboxylase biotin carboxyl carrier protein
MARIAVKSEITGKVWKIEAQPGQRVADGDTLIVLESMKMEIPVMASGDGTVAEVLVKEEDAVAEGQALVLLDT